MKVFKRKFGHLQGMTGEIKARFYLCSFKETKKSLIITHQYNKESVYSLFIMQADNNPGSYPVDASLMRGHIRDNLRWLDNVTDEKLYIEWEYKCSSMYYYVNVYREEEDAKVLVGKIEYRKENGGFLRCTKYKEPFPYCHGKDIDKEMQKEEVVFLVNKWVDNIVSGKLLEI